METVHFTRWLVGKGITNVFPDRIPDVVDASGSTAIIKYGSSLDGFNTSGYFELQFLTLAKDSVVASAKAQDVYERLTNLIDTITVNPVIDNYEVTVIKPLSAPDYIAIDEEKRYRYSFDVEIKFKQFRR